MTSCSIHGCGKPHKARGYCLAHYRRLRRHGDASAGKQNNAALQAFFEELFVRPRGEDCITWPFATNGAGYGQITVNGRRQYVHRLACERVNGPPPTDRHEAAHSCGNGHLRCVAPWHLSWKTRSGNCDDARLHGTIARGERHGRAKLTETDVRRIRHMFSIGKTQSSIAEIYGVGRPTIGKIATGQKWGWLP